METDFSNTLKAYAKRLESISDLPVAGELTRVVGFVMEAVGCRWPIGTRAEVNDPKSQISLLAEVVGFADEKTFLMSTDSPQGLSPGAKIRPRGHAVSVPVTTSMLGRIFDGNGAPLDGKAPITPDAFYPLYGKPKNPLLREVISEPLDVGIKAINGLLTVGRGQRIGLMAGSGVGKSVLLGMMSRYTEADINVVALIGERSREVKEFIEQNLGREGLARSVVIATPADTSPLMRINGALLATTIAEYFRDRGSNVLLMMDSLTRFAQAQRELSLSIGEPPTTKGYTPSVFAKLPQLVERAGNGSKEEGSITGFYTVLSEGDDLQDPIVDAARAILDGHLVLTRRLADAAHYPAIDVEASISRVMPMVTSDAHQQCIRRFRQLYATYQQNRDLITVGAYVKGSDSEVDMAIHYLPFMNEFLQQAIDEKFSFDASVALLEELAEKFTALVPTKI